MEISDLIDALLDIEEEQQPEEDYIWLDGYGYPITEEETH
jgi:hypothetical protein